MSNPPIIKGEDFSARGSVGIFVEGPSGLLEKTDPSYTYIFGLDKGEYIGHFIRYSSNMIGGYVEHWKGGKLHGVVVGYSSKGNPNLIKLYINDYFVWCFFASSLEGIRSIWKDIVCNIKLAIRRKRV
jgi:hypothetical protein